jgi:hypothetical protein
MDTVTGTCVGTEVEYGGGGDAVGASVVLVAVTLWAYCGVALRAVGVGMYGGGCGHRHGCCHRKGNGCGYESIRKGLEFGGSVGRWRGLRLGAALHSFCMMASDSIRTVAIAAHTWYS